MSSLAVGLPLRVFFLGKALGKGQTSSGLMGTEADAPTSVILFGEIETSGVVRVDELGTLVKVDELGISAEVEELGISEAVDVPA